MSTAPAPRPPAPPNPKPTPPAPNTTKQEETNKKDKKDGNSKPRPPRRKSAPKNATPKNQGNSKADAKKDASAPTDASSVPPSPAVEGVTEELAKASISPEESKKAEISEPPTPVTAPAEAEGGGGEAPSPTTEGKGKEKEAGDDAPGSKGPERKRTTPYVNPERVKTGGAQRDKLTEEELAEKMARMKEQNDKIKQRRMDVEADEEAFKKTQEQERQKAAHNRRIQTDINKARDVNAKRKMDKMQAREWDSGKPSNTGGAGRGGGQGRGAAPPAATTSVSVVKPPADQPEGKA